MTFVVHTYHLYVFFLVIAASLSESCFPFALLVTRSAANAFCTDVQTASRADTTCFV